MSIKIAKVSQLQNLLNWLQWALKKFQTTQSCTITEIPAQTPRLMSQIITILHTELEVCHHKHTNPDFDLKAVQCSDLHCLWFHLNPWCLNPHAYLDLSTQSNRTERRKRLSGLTDSRDAHQWTQRDRLRHTETETLQLAHCNPSCETTHGLQVHQSHLDTLACVCGKTAQNIFLLSKLLVKCINVVSIWLEIKLKCQIKSFGN